MAGGGGGFPRGGSPSGDSLARYRTATNGELHFNETFIWRLKYVVWCPHSPAGLGRIIVFPSAGDNKLILFTSTTNKITT